MRLLVLSDLHIEQAPFDAPQAAADVVVLAGDIHNGGAALQWARSTFPSHPIVQVAGNHEFYDGEYARVLDGMRDAARHLEIRFLENEGTQVAGVRFLGCTLWTDFRLFEAPGRPFCMDAAAAMAANRRLLADYFAISVDEGGVRRRFDPLDSARLHAASRAWLDRALAEPFDGPTVVVTHHLPSWRSVHPQYAAWVTNAGFASDLDELVARPDAWIHGHTHTSQRHDFGRARLLCNARGYPRSGDPPLFENPQFDPCCVLELDPG